MPPASTCRMSEHFTTLQAIFEVTTVVMSNSIFASERITVQHVNRRGHRSFSFNGRTISLWIGLTNSDAEVTTVTTRVFPSPPGCTSFTRASGQRAGGVDSSLRMHRLPGVRFSCGRRHFDRVLPSSKPVDVLVQQRRFRQRVQRGAYKKMPWSQCC
ncbi:uncharacterized protein LOC143364592 [Halictus rubicundus]|uniref:uncharacterized protein LOC143364592 n=1 Tax=Halictus rubicundus TaxID=77578 RepID=UPI0040354653